jgi:hypothetical protein
MPLRRQENPFVFGEIVTKDAFVDRADEAIRLTRDCWPRLTGRWNHRRIMLLRGIKSSRARNSICNFAAEVSISLPELTWGNVILCFGHFCNQN